MTEALRFVGIGMGVALLLLVLRKTSPPAAVALALAAGAALLLAFTDRLRTVVEALQSLSKMTGLEEEGALLLRVAGIGILCETGGRLCRDAGEEGLGEKVEMGGRLMMLSLTLPLAVSLLENVFAMFA